MFSALTVENLFCNLRLSLCSFNLKIVAVCFFRDLRVSSFYCSYYSPLQYICTLSPTIALHLSLSALTEETEDNHAAVSQTDVTRE